MQFFLYLNGTKRGPLSEERVQSLLAEGLLLGTDLASDAPEGEWRALATFRRFNVPLEPDQPNEPTLPAAAKPPEPALVAPARTAPPVLPPVSVGHGLSPLPLDALGPYARATLAPNETPFYRTSLHWIVFARFAGLALLVFLLVAMPFAIAVQVLTGSQIGWFALPLPAFILLPPTLAFASSELVITDRRVLIKTGMISRQTLEMFIPRIESVAVHQDVVGRMFDYGTVTIRGMGGSDEAFKAIAHPLAFRNTVQRLQGGAAAPARHPAAS